MLTGLNNTFKLSGNSVLPAYPGFIVTNTPTVDFIEISRSANMNLCSFFIKATLIVSNY